MVAFADCFDRSDFQPCLAAGFRRSQAGADILFGLARYVRFNLFS